MTRREATTEPPPPSKGPAIGQISAEELRTLARDWREEGSRHLARANDLERIADNLEGIGS
jgi:hypothetical protein